MSDRTIRVAIIDDHDMVREGLAAFLKAFPDMVLVGEGRDGDEAVLLCEATKVDVVLMDIVMPGAGGVEAIARLHQRWPELKIVALSSFEDEDFVKTAVSAGALSYLLKNISATKLAEAIRSAMEGLPTFSPQIAHALVASSPRGEGRKGGFDLTPRESEVLGLLSEGLSNDQISRRLQVSPNTVKNHVGNVLSKLGVRNRTEAAKLFLQGLPKEPPSHHTSPFAGEYGGSAKHR